MNRSTRPTNHITIHTRAGVVLAAFPVRQRAVASDRLLARLARRIFRRFVSTISIRRRPVGKDELTQAALIRDGLARQQMRSRGGPPPNLDAHYDLLRQLR